MKNSTMIVAAAALAFASATAMAAPRGGHPQGASQYTPPEIKEGAKTPTGPGASQYTPPEIKEGLTTPTGPGASHYTPGKTKK